MKIIFILLIIWISCIALTYIFDIIGSLIHKRVRLFFPVNLYAIVFSPLAAISSFILIFISSYKLEDHP